MSTTAQAEEVKPSMTATDFLQECKALEEDRERIVTSLRALDAQRATLLDTIKAHDGAIEIVKRLADKLTGGAKSKEGEA